MVWNPSTEEGIAFTFDAGDLEHRTLEVLSFVGHEEISTPYRYELELISDQLAIDPGPLLQKPALIRVKQRAPSAQKGIVTFKTHGKISSFEYIDGDAKIAFYRAIFVPRLWFLSLVTQSRIFMDKTVPQIVETVLAGNGLAGPDVEFRLSGSYPTREYVVQYEESDLNFVSRLLEHEGIFYYFEHGVDHEKIVFGDSPAAYGRLDGGETYTFRPQRDAQGAASDLFDEPVVNKIVYRQRHIPKSVTLQDYNWRTPQTELKSESEVVPHGIGELYEYGDHYKDPGDGARLAKVRAQEFACREKTFDGIGQVKSFRPGCLYTLQGHFRPDLSTRYLLTKVTHRGEQAISLTGPVRPMAKYQNDFMSIPAGADFRPERVAQKPKITGAITAWVDAAGDGKYAEIDDFGRYKVQIGFDRAGKGGATASRYVRMAQPHAGADMGIHFPLRKETEVLLLHVNGDPDRPFIAGAMPDPEAKSPVIGENQTQNLIRTGGGTEIRIEDNKDNEFFHLKTPYGETNFAMGAPHQGSPQSLDGFMMATKDVISLNAGKSISIHAGAEDHEKGTAEGANRLGAISLAGTALSTVIGCADAASGGIAGMALTILGLGAAGLAGADFAASKITGSPLLKTEVVHISAPKEASLIGQQSATLGSLMTTNVVGILTTSVLSAGQTLVGAVARCAMVAGLDCDVIAGSSNVHIKAGTATLPFIGLPMVLPSQGNVEVEAFNDFKVEANHEIRITAGQKGHDRDLGEIWIESVSPKGKAARITLTVANSLITISEEEIRLVADRIVLEANDKEAVLDLGKGTSGGAPFFAKCKKKMWLTSDTEVQATSKEKIYLKGEKTIAIKTDNLTLKADTEAKMGGGKLDLKSFKDVFAPSAHSF